MNITVRDKASGQSGDRSIMSDQKREKIILIDGHSILNRAFTAFRFCQTVKGCTRMRSWVF